MLTKLLKELREDFNIKLFYGGCSSYNCASLSGGCNCIEYPEDLWLTPYSRKDRVCKYQEEYYNQQIEEEELVVEVDPVDEKACFGNFDFSLPKARECNRCSLGSECHTVRWKKIEGVV